MTLRHPVSCVYIWLMGEQCKLFPMYISLAQSVSTVMVIQQIVVAIMFSKCTLKLNNMAAGVTKAVVHKLKIMSPAPATSTKDVQGLCVSER